MKQVSTSSLKRIEKKMEELEPNSLRYRILKSAREFKSSWIDLGRALYSVWRDKLYKEWGFSTFDSYTTKEIGIRKNTAMKLLRSYYFLEKEEPEYLKLDTMQDDISSTKIPTLESVEVLRKAKNKKILDESDYAKIKKELFEEGKDAQLVKKDLTSLIRHRQEVDPQEAWEKRRYSTIKRLVGVLKTLIQQMRMDKILSVQLIKETEKLIQKFEDELS